MSHFKFFFFFFNNKNVNFFVIMTSASHREWKRKMKREKRRKCRFISPLAERNANSIFCEWLRLFLSKNNHIGIKAIFMTLPSTDVLFIWNKSSLSSRIREKNYKNQLISRGQIEFEMWIHQFVNIFEMVEFQKVKYMKKKIRSTNSIWRLSKFWTEANFEFRQWNYTEYSKSVALSRILIEQYKIN